MRVRPYQVKFHLIADGKELLEVFVEPRDNGHGVVEGFSARTSFL